MFHLLNKLSFDSSLTLLISSGLPILDYKATYGNCMVPQRYLANPQLGTWVHTQRRQYKLLKGGKKSSMTAEKISRLNSVGFDWDAKAFLPATVPSTDPESD